MSSNKGQATKSICLEGMATLLIGQWARSSAAVYILLGRQTDKLFQSQHRNNRFDQEMSTNSNILSSAALCAVTPGVGGTKYSPQKQILQKLQSNDIRLWNANKKTKSWTHTHTQRRRWIRYTPFLHLVQIRGLCCWPDVVSTEQTYSKEFLLVPHLLP